MITANSLATPGLAVLRGSEHLAAELTRRLRSELDPDVRVIALDMQARWLNAPLTTCPRAARSCRPATAHPRQT